MEGEGGFPFGGDPEDLMRGLREFAAQQAESIAEAQREQFDADAQHRSRAGRRGPAADGRLGHLGRAGARAP